MSTLLPCITASASSPTDRSHGNGKMGAKLPDLNSELNSHDNIKWQFVDRQRGMEKESRCHWIHSLIKRERERERGEGKRRKSEDALGSGRQVTAGEWRVQRSRNQNKNPGERLRVTGRERHPRKKTVTSRDTAVHTTLPDRERERQTRRRQSVVRGRGQAQKERAGPERGGERSSDQERNWERQKDGGGYLCPP